MADRPSEPAINIEAVSHKEREHRLIARPEADPIEIDKLSDSVRIPRTPRAEATRRELMQQPLPPE